MTRYDAYILRMWRDNGDEGSQYRFKVGHLGHNETTEFNDHEAFLQHICTLSSMEGGRVSLVRTQLKGSEP